MTNCMVVEGRGRVARSILSAASRNYFKIGVSRGRYGVSVPFYRPFGGGQRHKGSIQGKFRSSFVDSFDRLSGADRRLPAAIRSTDDRRVDWPYRRRSGRPGFAVGGRQSGCTDRRRF